MPRGRNGNRSGFHATLCSRGGSCPGGATRRRRRHGRPPDRAGPLGRPHLCRHRPRPGARRHAGDARAGPAQPAHPARAGGPARLGAPHRGAPVAAHGARRPGRPRPGPARLRRPARRPARGWRRRPGRRRARGRRHRPRHRDRRPGHARPAAAGPAGAARPAGHGGPVRARDRRAAGCARGAREVGPAPGPPPVPGPVGGIMTVHVVGGGIAGLVAAITAAEEGAPVVLHEASGRLGGRALAGPVGGGDGRPGLNLGPRVLHTDGVIWRWARRQGVTLATRRPRLGGTRLLAGPAAVDVDFRAWATDNFGPERATLMCRLAGLFTYHHDPGATSARFAWERYRRTFVHVHHVRYVEGGWSTLVDALADRAAALGVEVRTGEPARAGDLPEGPTVVATSLRSAGRVLGRDLRWPGSRTALLDVELAGPAAWPETVADVRDDLVTCCLV